MCTTGNMRLMFDLTPNPSHFGKLSATPKGEGSKEHFEHNFLS